MSQQNANLPPKNPEISIVVPVYRVEKYLNSCIDSLLAQTFADFEVILVDDGSAAVCSFSRNCGATQSSESTKASQLPRAISSPALRAPLRPLLA